MKFESYTIVISGLGGQGLIRLLQILGNALMREGYKVITSETHGLSQRGGKVTCFLRFGNKLNAPIPMTGTADMIIALEESSILDVLKYTRPDKNTKLVISTYEKKIIGKEYPSLNYLLDTLFEHSDYVYFIPVANIAKEIIKGPKTVNTIMLGYILRFLPIKKEKIERSLEEHFSKKKIDMNLYAFREGYKLQ
ncbi:MAG: 2-oxoacid:acceptor oxidoreductase family protein [Candidatus Hermodarchaeota archaeon]